MPATSNRSSPRPSWWGISLLLALCLSAAALPTEKAIAQPANENGPVALLLETNPLLAAVAKASPDALPVITGKLVDITTGSRPGRTRSDLTPTRAEQAQFAANPAFEAARRKSPDETLLLLRQANEALQQQRSEIPANRRRIALVVGNSRYQRFPWSTLPNADKDVKLVATALQEAGFTLIGNGPQLDLDKASLAHQIAALQAASHAGTATLFYFAGHGVQHDGKDYLVPADGSSEVSTLLEIRPTALNTLENADTSVKIIVLDACRSEMKTRGYTSDPPGLKEAGEAAAGTYVMYSTEPNQIASDGIGSDKNSPFAEAFVREMMKPGIEIRQMLQAVTDDVVAVTDHKQVPTTILAASRGTFYFLPPDARPALTAAIPPVQPHSVTRLSDEQLMAAARGMHTAHRYEAEAPLLEEAAGRGITGAFFQLGSEYELGDGRVRDYKSAADWYQKGVDAGNASSMVNLGNLYENGQGVPRNLALAYTLFAKAAAAGAADGMTNLGNMLEEGRGVAPDHARAEALYLQASAIGSPTAMSNLGRFYRNHGRPQDGLNWTRRAADLGSAPALDNLATYYLTGELVAPNPQLAVSLFQKAAGKDDVHAMRTLAGIYSDGKIVPRDERQAMQWYQRAAQQGDVYSMAASGMGFARGFGVPRDCQQATYWFQQAASHGSVEARTILSRGGFCA